MIPRFPSMEEARCWYDSPKYQEARKHRQNGAAYSVLIVEGIRLCPKVKPHQAPAPVFSGGRPDFEIIFDRFSRDFCGGFQPPVRPAFHVILDRCLGVGICCVNTGEIKSHGRE